MTAEDVLPADADVSKYVFLRGFYMAQLTPMMQQYFDIKNQHKDAILFFRLGDFYEMFFDDALTASRELEITLTGRDCGMDERAPMCGVPFHAADNYIARLIGKGFKVAICEQVEDPAIAKGIVKRDVVRIVTPGTLVETNLLDEKKNNYLIAVYKDKYFGIATVDISTGELLASSIQVGNVKGKLLDEISKIQPTEMIANTSVFEDLDLINAIQARTNVFISETEPQSFLADNAKETILRHMPEAEIEHEDVSTHAVGALLSYLEKTQKTSLANIRKIQKYCVEGFMLIDSSSRRNLEIIETMRDKNRKGSLLWVLDKTVTSMGARTLRKWIEQPLLNLHDITDRQDGVEEMKEKFMVRSEVREVFKRVYDIERLVGKVNFGNVNGRDLVALKNSIAQIPYIKEILSGCTSNPVVFLESKLDGLEDIHSLLDDAIIDEPPVTIKEGGIIKTGFNEEVDNLRNATTEGKNWIAALEAKERSSTGIRNLKIGFNKIFGYFIEVTKSYFSMVPGHYIRKQTLANCERFITDELKKIEETVLGAEEKVIDIEYNIFLEVKEQIASASERLQTTGRSISELDALMSLAEVADRENYIRPTITEDGVIHVVDSRHPVVEKMIGVEGFVPNDTLLDLEDNRLMIITGPNMAGKSTYMRQTALMVLMAQAGSFVPAKEAKIGLVDRIFTRVGASDDLASGQSTFMVEMSEVANILENATNKSLLILDEIGRGTSTFDGLSIAWAVIEFIGSKQKLGARTLFATHYHELTELEGKVSGIKNYCISVLQKGEDIIFLRKIIRGGADGSYGIQVARLAGVPKNVIDRAKEILKELEDADISNTDARIRKNKKPIDGQVNLFVVDPTNEAENDVLDSLKNIDATNLTPIEALNLIYSYQLKLRNG